MLLAWSVIAQDPFNALPAKVAGMPIEPEHTSYKVLDFLKWQRDGTLVLRPPFQRKAVWRPALKSSLIDSLLRGYPIPALFLQDRSDATSFERRLVVIDGQQRLRTVLSYVDISCLPDADDRDNFSLLRMHDASRPNARFVDLPEEDRAQIVDARLTVYLVDSGVTEAELLEIFRRMNTYGAKLNAQELRNAQFSGLFKELAYGLASDFYDYWLGWGTLNKQQIAEMRDAEFTGDLMLLSIDGASATTRKRLDDAYERFDETFEQADDCAERVRELMSTLDSIFRGENPVARLLPECGSTLSLTPSNRFNSVARSVVLGRESVSRSTHCGAGLILSTAP